MKTLQFEIEIDLFLWVFVGHCPLETLVIIIINVFLFTYLFYSIPKLFCIWQTDGIHFIKHYLVIIFIPIYNSFYWMGLSRMEIFCLTLHNYLVRYFLIKRLILKTLGIINDYFILESLGQFLAKNEGEWYIKGSFQNFYFQLWNWWGNFNKISHWIITCQTITKIMVKHTSLGCS